MLGALTLFNSITVSSHTVGQRIEGVYRQPKERPSQGGLRGYNRLNGKYRAVEGLYWSSGHIDKHVRGATISAYLDSAAESLPICLARTKVPALVVPNFPIIGEEFQPLLQTVSLQ